MTHNNTQWIWMVISGAVNAFWCPPRWWKSSASGPWRTVCHLSTWKLGTFLWPEVGWEIPAMKSHQFYICLIFILRYFTSHFDLKLLFAVVSSYVCTPWLMFHLDWLISQDFVVLLRGLLQLDPGHREVPQQCQPPGEGIGQALAPGETCKFKMLTVGVWKFTAPPFFVFQNGCSMLFSCFDVVWYLFWSYTDMRLVSVCSCIFISNILAARWNKLKHQHIQRKCNICFSIWMLYLVPAHHVPNGFYWIIHAYYSNTHSR